MAWPGCLAFALSLRSARLGRKTANRQTRFNPIFRFSNDAQVMPAARMPAAANVLQQL
ncbi:hypothetical protein E4U55_002266 [Claviceps digitariae]|nr:hypothetical protein E4U55_002266 [Claviceps digitariae]